MAKHFATLLQNESASINDQVDQAYLLLTGRSPSPDEADEMAAYARKHGLAALCRVLFNLSEFVFVD